MAERQLEMLTNSNNNDKDRMRDLYRQQVPGTENLYQGIGYFMRMRFWAAFDNIFTKIMCACEEKDYRDIYIYVIEMMSNYIKSPSQKTENVNNMIFNRTMVKANYGHCPCEFVMQLRQCFEKEKELLEMYLGIDVEQNQTCFVPTWLPSLSQNFDIKEEIKPKVIDEVADLKPPGISVDTSFLNLIDQKYSESDFVELLRLMETSLGKLREIRDQFLCYQAQMDVGLMQKGDILCQVSALFDRYAKYLNLKEFYSSTGCPSTKQVEITDAYIDMALIVRNHPEGYAFIENPKKPENDDEVQSKVKKEHGESSKTSKGKGPKYFCSKKKSHLSATLMILGGRHLKEILNIECPSVMLTTEEGEKAGELFVGHYSNWRDSEISLQGIKVSDHKRESAKNTRSQFLRLAFTVHGTCYGREFELQTKSLPFNLVTGSLQALEFTGTRLWYFFCNLGDMYSNCQMNEELDKNHFLDMLDQIIKTISYENKFRKLSFDDKKFLWNQIPPKKGRSSVTATTISEQCFSKTEIGKTAEMGECERKFSFFTWFYAMVNTLDKCLLKPWVDGIIYGLMTKKEAEQVLFGDNIPPLTALLRPVRSFVITPNCKAAQIKIAVEIKYHYGDEDKVGVIDISADEFITLGLYDKLNRICIKGLNISTSSAHIQYILTSNNTLVPLAELKDKYRPIASRQSHSASSGVGDEGYHRSVVERLTELCLDVTNKEKPSDLPPAAKSSRHSHDVCTPVQYFSRNRKVVRRESSDAASICTTTTGSPFSSVSSPNDQCNDARSPGVASNTTTVLSPQVWESADNNDEGTVIQDVPNPASPNWVQFGQVHVDTTNMAEQMRQTVSISNACSSMHQNHMSNSNTNIVSNNLPNSINQPVNTGNHSVIYAVPIPTQASTSSPSTSIPFTGNGINTSTSTSSESIDLNLIPDDLLFQFGYQNEPQTNFFTGVMDISDESNHLL